MGGRKKKKDKRKERGWERKLGMRKEKRGWRKEEEIWNKGKARVGERRRVSPLAILLSSTSEGFFSLVQCSCVDQLSLVSWEKCPSAEVVKLNTFRVLIFRMFVG